MLSGEWPVYRIGRLDAVRALDLRPGDRVLDLACGSGLNLPLVRAEVGHRGRVVAVDASPSMLGAARRRVGRARWDNVELVLGDARHLADLVDGDRFDAAIATYAFSVLPAPELVWRQLLGTVRPGGRIAVADLSLPVGRASALRPLARLACWGGGADPGVAPWRWVEEDLVDTVGSTRRGGHVVVRSGRRDVRPDRSDDPRGAGA